MSNSGITFVKTYEIKEFKALVKTSNISIWKNPDGAGYFRYLENDAESKVFPLTSKASVEETLQDPVISLGFKEVPRARGESKPPEKEILYIMHPRANSGHIMMANL